MGSKACNTPMSATYTLTNTAEPMERAARDSCEWRPATMVSVTPKAITASCPASTVSACRAMVDSSDIIESFTRANAGAISMFALSAGNRVNRFLLDMLSYKNRGDSLVVAELHVA